MLLVLVLPFLVIGRHARQHLGPCGGLRQVLECGEQGSMLGVQLSVLSPSSLPHVHYPVLSLRVVCPGHRGQSHFEPARKPVLIFFTGHLLA